MKLDPSKEAEYRAKLARGYLERAEALQLDVENAAKTMA